MGSDGKVIVNCSGCGKEMAVSKYTVGAKYWCSNECSRPRGLNLDTFIGKVVKFTTTEEALKDATPMYILGEEVVKPIKVVYDALPCPKDPTERCEYSKMESLGMVAKIYCTQEKCYKTKI